MICYGVWIFIEVGVVDGCIFMSYLSFIIDFCNVGVIWVDEEVVVDEGLVFSWIFDDFFVFNVKFVEEIGEGKYVG